MEQIKGDNNSELEESNNNSNLNNINNNSNITYFNGKKRYSYKFGNKLLKNSQVLQIKNPLITKFNKESRFIFDNNMAEEYISRIKNNNLIKLKDN